MAFDRSRYKGTSLSKINEGISDAETNSTTAKGGGNFEKTKYHQLEEGDNWFKIAPAHEPEDSPYVPIAVVNLECEGDKWEDGEITGKEVKNRKVFVATVHSPKDKNGKLIVSKDPTETYLSYLNKKLNEEYPDKADRETKLAPVRGFRDKDKKWIFGIQPDHKIATWAWNKSNEIGRLDLSKKQFREMEKLSIRETAEEAMSSDIFVDLDEGFPVIITKTVTGEGNKKKTEYSVSIDVPNARKRETADDFFERVSPTDKMIEEWQAKKSLKELFVESYQEKDFNMAVDGLERFDKKWSFGVFDDTEFLDEIEEISKMVDSLPKKVKEDEEPKSDKKSETSVKSKTKVEVEEVSPIQMKKLLRAYIATNYDEDTVLPELSKSDLKKWYELALAEEELPFDEKEKEELPVKDSSEDDVDPDEVENEIANLRRRRK